MPKNGKNRADTSWTFDSLVLEAFDTVASVGASVASTTIQSFLPIPQRFKIAKVGICFSAASGTAAFNIAIGTVAESGCNTVRDGLAVAGNTVFSSDQSITVANTNQLQLYIPTQPDTIYDTGSTTITSGALLTLRCVTAAASSLTNFKVSLVVALLDAKLNDQGGVPGTNW